MTSFRKLLAGFLAAAMLAAPEALAAGDQKELKHKHFHFEGWNGHFDRAAAQRGYQVFSQVCSGCHSLDYFTFRTLAGIGYPEEQIKAIAAQYTVPGEPDDYGEPTTREAIPADAWPWSFPNEQAAKVANGGALPPDLSLITKARHHGPQYIYSLLTGYEEEPPAEELPLGLYYNPYMPGGAIAMAQPLYDDLIEYQDGTPATIEQMAADVVTFLHYVAEPKMEERKQMGFGVLAFLAILTLLMWRANKKIWKPVKRGENVAAGQYKPH